MMKVGIIGLGRIAESAYIDAIKKSENTKLVSICYIDKK